MSEPLVNRSDERLIAATLAGDRQAFGDLVCRYQDRLYNSLVHLLANPADAQDVMQDAFVLAFTKLQTYRGQSGFFTWLIRIARNTAISRLRRGRKAMSLDGQADQGPLPLVADEPAPDQRILTGEVVAEVRSALSRLSEEHRAILILREMEELDYDAIADVLDMPVGTVRSRLHRARLQLKAELEAGQAASARRESISKIKKA